MKRVFDDSLVSAGVHGAACQVLELTIPGMLRFRVKLASIDDPRQVHKHSAGMLQVPWPDPTGLTFVVLMFLSRKRRI